MVPSIRQAFNQQFTTDQYKAYLEELNSKFPGAIEFRVAETPVFVDRSFKEKILSACEHIVDVITQFNFKTLSSHAIPVDLRVPNENDHTHFIAFDFGVFGLPETFITNKNGEIIFKHTGPLTKKIIKDEIAILF